MKTSYVKSLFILFAVALSFSSCRKEEAAAPDSSIGESVRTEKGQAASGRTAATIEEEILSLVNAHRQSIGLAPLAMQSVISGEALTHSQNMANGTVPFGHTGFSDRASRIRSQLGGNGVSENVAYGYSSAQAVVQGWLNSSGHRTNIEGSYTHTGIGVATDANGVKYYTQIFLNAPNLSTPAPTPTPQPTPTPTPTPTPAPTLLQIEQDILTLINNHRSTKGLPPLTINSAVQAEARQHSQNMADGKIPFGHSGFSDRANRLMTQLNGKAAAENVAYGQTSAQAVVNAWLNSTGHRRNIEGNYNLTGIGVVQNSRGRYYFTQLFIRN